MSTRDLLFELGTEELPAGEIIGMVGALCRAITEGLEARGLTFSGVQQLSTPRRLSVLITALSENGPDNEQHVVGPPLSAARDESGEWTKAALGFARKQGIDPSALSVVEDQGVERIAAHVFQKGAHAPEVIPGIIEQAVAAIPVSKRMRWGRSRDEFLRPVQWLVLLFGDDVLPLSLFSLTSGRETRGHRFHHHGAVSIAAPDQYQQRLREAYVIADPAERKTLIAEQVSALVKSGEAVALSEDLLDEVTGLVEWPVALRGSFDSAFLTVPAQALVSAMKSHQKYFHLNDATSGSLLPAFITIANIESDDPAQVIAGNERVIRPRLADAAFFFANDKEQPLISRQSRLGGVVFHNALGSLLDKTGRVEAIATHIAGLIGADTANVARAAALAKCDLVSEMVLEFPELQGVAGAEYARHDGEPEAVALAIEDQYRPRFAGDDLPNSTEGAALALADRLDTLVGIFGIGEPPTGSKDPFALRRASLAVIRIVVALKQPLPLLELLEFSCKQHQSELADGTASTVLTYMLERLDSWYEDRGINVDIVRAVLAAQNNDLYDVDLRVSALAAFSEQETARHLAAANKRVANILAKAEAAEIGAVDPARFSASEESALFSAIQAAEVSLKPLIEQKQYQGALEELASLRQPVDDFFDAVMVNTEDPLERENRLRLLRLLRALFVQLADIALLPSGSE